MKLVKRIAIITLSIIVVLLIGAMIYIDIKLPELPYLTNSIIDRALEKNRYKLKGKQDYAINDDTKIWYESIQPQDTVKGHIILIMGIANDALAWPDYFINSLVDSGYHVVRYDNRGTGMSDWVEDWDENNPYSLEDLSEDIIAILDTLEIEKVHVIGASFGGMIGQTLAINHPDRVITLVSMLSTGHITDPELPSINMEMIATLLMAQVRYGLIYNETNQIKLQITSRLLLMGDNKYDLDLENISGSVLYNLRNRNGYNPDASKQHIAATMKSGSRYSGLNALSIPTLVIHGKSDPLIDFSHGVKTYENIPNADSLWIDGMGHDIPLIYNDIVISRITSHIQNNSNYNE